MSESSGETVEQHHVFRPERTHILAAGVMIGISLLIVGANPLLLFWLPLLPLIFIYWVLRAHTIVNTTGVTAHYAFAKEVATPWSDIVGIGFGKSQAFIQTTAGRKVSLPGVTFNSLPALEEASAGRIPDALTQGRIAADEKVVVVHKDGRQVLMTKAEYEQHEQEKQQASATEGVEKQAPKQSDESAAQPTSDKPDNPST